MKKKNVHVIPSFHYDVAYLSTYQEYLPRCFHIIDEALKILGQDSNYCFLIEQVILIEEYLNHYPEKKELMKNYINQGRLTVEPGMYVMPDMNHPSGESLYMQAKLGKEWLIENFDFDSKVCWIADCWGHHAQIPQILTQCGYEYYVFWRCMRRDVLNINFKWQGLNGTAIKTHWLSTGYAGLRFPNYEESINALELTFASANEKQILSLCEKMNSYEDEDTYLICNGGDFVFPQESSSKVMNLLQHNSQLNVTFSTPERYLSEIHWDEKNTFADEFNSSLQGTFTSNIRIKLYNRKYTNRLIALEALSVILMKKTSNYEDIWKLVLKQQFHDIICGTITDQALEDCYNEFNLVDEKIRHEVKKMSHEQGKLSVFNSLPFEYTDMIEVEGTRRKLTLPALGFAQLEDSKITTEALRELPLQYENEFYRAEINELGYIQSLCDKKTQKEFVRNNPSSFGSLIMQIDNGDLWLNFESPLDGGSDEATLTQNLPDPFSRHVEGSIVNNRTFVASIEKAYIDRMLEEEVIIVQEGKLSFWTLNVTFKTYTYLQKHSPVIKYKTSIMPKGKHYRIRVAFPTTIESGEIRHEIPYGIVTRGEHEHIAQNWMDYSNSSYGLALFNKGTPGNNVDQGIMMLTLFRSAAMEYKTSSDLSYNEGILHTFEYGIMTHSSYCDAQIVKFAQIFNAEPIICQVNHDSHPLFKIENDHVMISALRWNNDCIFIRLYESIGHKVKGKLHIPDEITNYAQTDGLERPIEDFKSCNGFVEYELNAFEVKGFLFHIK